MLMLLMVIWIVLARVSKLRKLVTKSQVHVSLGLIFWAGGRVVGRRLKLHEPFWGDWCWEFKCKKMDDNQKKKSFRNNSISDLGPFQEKRLGLLKLHARFLRGGERRGFPVWKENWFISKNIIFYKSEKCHVKRLFRTYWKLVYIS